ncbi:crossover junction endodeoxyribonuclease RuvC [Aminithiophilus ramosus]|uniref:Crossover junction endodeoxyribonuclease RuvC n=2 Tax=Synergistales TaxID=649776 RepID=A0A9Q7EYJ6_9BACT|nr:crossover junction endodeoxyribonuclease RuvC [Aminithiophilus ramosus]QTX33580.1 crossover junction endodeoxyribonuclease RuvC [Aminithiophilus ramosus]QVL37434.1 crossover junction endodeoxyribonuclease RuvC [Synergistota bacterium]
MRLEERDRRCLGIDPGLGRIGFGLVLQRGNSLKALSFGCIETPADHSLSERLLLLDRRLGELLDEGSPHFVAVERLFFGRNTTTAAMVWQARGVILLAGARRGLPLFEPKPSEVKLAVCGHGSADKGQVQGMVQRLLGLDERPRPDDAADALAAAIAALAMEQFGRRIDGGDLSC